MSEKQLDLFEPEDLKGTGAFDDDYRLSVNLNFTRTHEGVTTSHHIELGEKADQLHHLCAAFTNFVQQLGFGYVTEIVAFNALDEQVS
jgi:hypothetical protein